MRLWTLIGASAGTSIAMVCQILEAIAEATLVGDAFIRIIWGTTIVLWLGFMSAHCRDSTIRNSDRRAAELVSALNRGKADLLAEIKEAVGDATASALAEVKDVVDHAITDAMEEAGHREATAARLDMLARNNGQAQPNSRRGMSIVD